MVNLINKICQEIDDLQGKPPKDDDGIIVSSDEPSPAQQFRGEWEALKQKLRKLEVRLIYAMEKFYRENGYYPCTKDAAYYCETLHNPCPPGYKPRCIFVDSQGEATGGSGSGGGGGARAEEGQEAEPLDEEDEGAEGDTGLVPSGSPAGTVAPMVTTMTVPSVPSKLDAVRPLDTWTTASAGTISPFTAAITPLVLLIAAPGRKDWTPNILEYLLELLREQERRELNALRKELVTEAKRLGLEDVLNPIGGWPHGEKVFSKDPEKQKKAKNLDDKYRKASREVRTKYRAARGLAVEAAKRWYEKHGTELINLKTGKPEKTPQQKRWGHINKSGWTNAVLKKNSETAFNEEALRRLGKETIKNACVVLGEPLGLSGGALVKLTRYGWNKAIEKISELLASEVGEAIAKKTHEASTKRGE